MLASSLHSQDLAPCSRAILRPSAKQASASSRFVESASTVKLFAPRCAFGSCSALIAQLAFHAIQFRRRVTFPSFLGEGKRFLRNYQSLFGLVCLRQSGGQQGKEIGPPQAGAGRLAGCQAVTHAFYSFLYIPQFDLGPTQVNIAERQPEIQSKLVGQSDDFLCPFVRQ